MTMNRSKLSDHAGDFSIPIVCLYRYSTFVRIGTGLSFADYVWVRQKPWKEWDPKNTPSFLSVASNSQEDKGDVYLEPEE